MSGYLESSFQAWACTYADTRGWLVRLIQYRGRRGGPDMLAIKAGRVLLVELKKIDGDLRLTQEREHTRLKNAGAEIFTAYTVDEIKEIFA
jgi:hypothetical protein